MALDRVRLRRPGGAPAADLPLSPSLFTQSSLFGIGIAFSPLHIALLLLLLLGPSPLKRGGLFVAAWLLVSLLEVILLLSVGHGLLLTMEQGSDHRTGLDLLAAGALLAIGQTDLKRLIAYTSVSHFGFIALGIFVMTTQGQSGSALYMVNHGFSTAALFLIAGFLISRRGSRLIEDFGGVQKVAPILAGTFLIGAAMTAGDVYVRGARAEHLESLLEALMRAGCRVDIDARGIRARMTTRPRAVGMVTAPFPGFPTDLQAQWTALLCVADGRAEVHERIFENRFMHVEELARMGADVHVQGGGHAVVQGVERLSGAPVMATDLRASASLIIAGLCAAGESEVSRIYHLDRGYERMEVKLRALGAVIERIPE